MTIDEKAYKKRYKIDRTPLDETEWYVSGDSVRLLTTAQQYNIISDRKIRLFVVACYRQISKYLSDDVGKEEVQTGILFADAQATLDDLNVALHRLGPLLNERRQNIPLRNFDQISIFYDALQSHILRPPEDLRDAAGIGKLARGVLRVISAVSFAHGMPDQLLHEMKHEQADFVRDLFGPLPFREIPIAPDWFGWNNGSIVKIANTMYENEDFGDFAILGDLLEEAGCQDRQILSHCRTSKPHIKGCWLLDLLLGKS